MGKQKKSALCIRVDGKRLYIDVPSGRALDLHKYLRSNRIRSAPPEPAFTGSDSIELANDSDIGAVQALLNGWNTGTPAFPVDSVSWTLGP